MSLPTRAMIFAAGLGTRFKPWTDHHPKALAVVNGKTLLQRNVEYLQQYGIRDVVVNVHHFAAQLWEAVRQHSGWGSRITISDESDEVLETGGGLLKARDLLGNEPFLTLNADVLTDLDLEALARFHRERQAFITLSVTGRETSRFLLFDEEDRLAGWRNTNPLRERIVRPGLPLVEKGYSTVALFEPGVFDLIPFTGKFSLIDVFLHLAPTHPVLGYDHTGGRFVDVGRPESVAVAEEMFR